MTHWHVPLSLSSLSSPFVAVSVVIFFLLDVSFIVLSWPCHFSIFICFSMLPQYFLPVISHDSCFSQTWNLAATSFCMPLFSIVLLSFSHTTAQSNCIGPFTGSLASTALSLIERISHSILDIIICGLQSISGSFIGSRNLLGIDSCTIRHMLAQRMVLNVAGSVIFPSNKRFTATTNMCAWASLR